MFPENATIGYGGYMTLKIDYLLVVGLANGKKSLISLRRLTRRKPRHERLKKGQRFQECDKRFTRVVEIVGFVKGRVKIKTISSPPNTFKAIGRVTTARRDRFHRRSHGYQRLYGHCHECQLERGAEVPSYGHRGITITIGICSKCLAQNVGLVPSSDYNWPKEGKTAIWD